MELFTWCRAVLCFLVPLLNVVAVVHAYIGNDLIDLQECNKCSNRADVPCKLSELNFPCYHNEFHQTWPGKPRDLKVEKIFLNSSMVQLNFTWSPPYDASIHSLQGFILMLNMIADHPHIHLPPSVPRCFYGNLSSTNWSAVPDKHAVVFHFDCLRSSNLVEANLLVTSAPMPNIDPEGASIKVQIGIAALETVLQSCPVIRQKRLPIYDPFITPASPNMTVGYWTHGDVVRAWFKPALSNNLYRMCLIASQDQLQCYDKKFVKNSNETVFTNVKAGRYYVWVSNERDNTFYSTKEFNVTGPEVEALPLSHKTIIMMGTVGCLGVIIIITVTTYVIKRRMGLHIPCCGNWLSCSKYHYQAPSLHPNNTVETELETGPAPLKVMPVTLPYCEKYQVAVDAVMKYLEEWANIEIQHMSFDEILNNCDSLPTSTVFAIFYSPQMEQVLNSSVITPPHCKPFFSADMLNSIHALFSKINQKEYSKIMITFEDLYYQDSFSLFKDTQIIQLSSDESFSTNLGNLLRLLASADLPQGWFTNPMVSDLTKKINIYRSMCVFGHAETNNHVGHCQTHSPLIHAGQRYDIENKLKMIDNRVLNTHSTIQTRLGSHSAAEKWVEEQNYLQFEVLVESVSECGDPWESPHESDNESETMTSLCRRTDQINQNYDRC